MKQILLAFVISLLYGFLFGTIIAAFGLPSPAPRHVAGVVAVAASILGIYLGYGLMLV